MNLTCNINHNLNEFPIQNNVQLNDQPISLFGRAILWLRAPNESPTVRKIRKIFALLLAIILSATIVGIIPVVLGVKTWKRQDQEQVLQSNLGNVQKLVNLQQIVSQKQSPSIPKDVNVTKIPTAVGQANLDVHELKNFTFSKITDEMILEKQERVIAVNPKYGTLNLDTLKSNQLLPTNKMVLGEVEYYCSDVFKFNDNFAVIALVEINHQVFPRLFYHSNSQGTWRVMPFAGKLLVPFLDEEKKHVVHFGKGQCETDTQLPIPLICALNKQSTTDAKSSPFDAGQIVETRVGKPPVFLDQVHINQSMFLEEGAKNGFVNTGMAIPKPPDPKANRLPEDVNLHPDFSLTLASFKQTIPHYGEVTVQIFRSKDGKLAYMFYETRDGRAFLASIECIRDVGINSYGVREKIIRVENMDAPLLEYEIQISPGFEPKDPLKNRYESGKYQNNWNYIRELEVIRLYYQEQGRELPDPV